MDIIAQNNNDVEINLELATKRKTQSQLLNLESRYKKKSKKKQDKANDLFLSGDFDSYEKFINNKHNDCTKISKKAERCGKCGNEIRVLKYENIETKENKVKYKARFCDVKWCPVCAGRKTDKLVREFRSIIEQIETHYKDKKLTYLFLTLAVKNPPLSELRETIKKMNKAFRSMWRDEELRKKHILGYIRSIEFLGDKTKAGYAHPHFHVILVVDSSYFSRYYISQQKWIDMWQKYLKVDYKPTANIKRIKDNPKKNMEAKDAALYEVLKYSVAPASIANLSNDDFDMLDEQTSNVRLYDRGGVFREFKPLVENENEKLDPKAWRIVESILFYWKSNLKEYEAYKKNVVDDNDEDLDSDEDYESSG